MQLGSEVGLYGCQELETRIQLTFANGGSSPVHFDFPGCRVADSGPCKI